MGFENFIEEVREGLNESAKVRQVMGVIRKLGLLSDYADQPWENPETLKAWSYGGEGIDLGKTDRPELEPFGVLTPEESQELIKMLILSREGNRDLRKKIKIAKKHGLTPEVLDSIINDLVKTGLVGE